MKIFEVIEAKKRPQNDWDDEDDAPAQDADLDKIPHILMQMRKAVDTDGNYEFRFKDGSKHMLDIPDIVTFVKKYMTAKPQEKEMMQNKAIESLEGLMSVINAQAAAKPDMKIKGDRYMSGFAGDYDDK
jgi:hypothetical protein